jgi:hypothetical protein
MSGWEEKIVGWLGVIGCEPRPVEDAHMEWHYEFDYPKGRRHRMHVAGVPGPEPSVAVVSLTRVSEQHIERFRALPDEGKRAFLFGLRRALNHPEVDFEMRGRAQGLDCPESFQVSVRRFADGLTLDGFALTVGRIYKVELNAIWYIQEALEGRRVTPKTVFPFDRSNMPEA